MDGSGQAHLIIMIIIIMMKLIRILIMMTMMMMRIQKDCSLVEDSYEAVSLVIEISGCRKQIGFFLSAII